MSPTIGISEFVKRQTKGSRFSHFDYGDVEFSWHLLKGLVAVHFHLAKPGYRDGVVLVPVPVVGFFCGVVEITEATALEVIFDARREGEAPFIQVVAKACCGEKLPAKAVDIVLYRRDVLEESGDAATGADWDIISINARPTEEPEPLTPMAMARNFLDLPGGTKAEYSAEAFAKAIIYWSKRAMCG